ncbi:hypothetical protein RIF29_23927 [Crotalaria pallida]|uniref:Uncharacterized protein n=1 Tax=Crotalaria pallida TaxID=3830 RepID=A0AAN9HYE7_CROPI
MKHQQMIPYGCINMPFHCPCSRCSPGPYAMILANLEHARKVLNNPNLSSYEYYVKMRESQMETLRELTQFRIEQDIKSEIMDEIMKLVRQQQQQLNEGAAENVAPGAGKSQFLGTTHSRSRGTQTDPENVADVRGSKLRRWASI